MNKAPALAAALLLGGCAFPAAVPAAGAGGAAGWFLAAQDAAKTADDVLAADAPLKRAACAAELKKSHGPGAEAFFKTYCANIPTTVGQAINTWAMVYVAVSVADQEGAAP